MTIIANLLQVIQENILKAALSENHGQNIQLLAVSKTQSTDKIREAYMAGQIHFGESYVQEAINKINLLSDCNINWHFIGPIQSNKTQLIAHHFNWVHAIDRLKIVQRLANARPADSPPLNICIQVNSSNEDSKNGVAIAQIEDLAAEIVKLPALKLRGLMSIPAPTKDVAKQRAQFKIVKNAFDHLQQRGFEVDTLSMGMSDDYVAAIQEGATIVRIGSAIFGARPKTKTMSLHT